MTYTSTTKVESELQVVSLRITSILRNRETFLYSLFPQENRLSPFFPSSLRRSSDFTQWHHPVSWLAWLLQGCPELCLGDRSPARLPHQNHLRQVPVTTAWAVGVRGDSSAVGWPGSWDGWGTSTDAARSTRSEGTGADALGRAQILGIQP